MSQLNNYVTNYKYDMYSKIDAVFINQNNKQNQVSIKNFGIINQMLKLYNRIVTAKLGNSLNGLVI